MKQKLLQNIANITKKIFCKNQTVVFCEGKISIFKNPAFIKIILPTGRRASKWNKVID